MAKVKINPEIEESWKQLVLPQFELPYFQDLKAFLIEEKLKYAVYPLGKDIFSAFNHTKVENVKVVILGQDPYHGHEQAHGLCFSVPNGIKPPPSLVNIFKELHSDIGIEIPKTGNLEPWAKQGVFLLNATLTVRANQAGSHQNKGWEIFTDFVIKALSEASSNLVFLLWGKFAQSKEQFIDKSKHLVLKAPHPSPFSAHSGFFGCNHFSKTNNFLISKEKKPINWQI